MKFTQSQITTTEREYQSPSFQRMQSLAQKWSQIRKGMDNTNIERKELVEHSIQKIENLLNYDKSKDDEKFLQLKDAFSKFHEQVNYERIGRESWAEKYQDQLIAFEDNLNKSIIDEQNSKKKVEIQLLRQIEERFDNLNGILEKNNKSYYDKFSCQMRDIGNQVNTIKYTLDNETQQRSDSQQHLVEQMDQEINKFSEMINIERQIREETNKKIYQMIEDIHQQIQNEIETEKHERLLSQESMLKLLEGTCIKIDDNFSRL